MEDLEDGIVVEGDLEDMGGSRGRIKRTGVVV